MTLHDKTIIITGASRGIGAAAAVEAARRGANVVLTARDEAKLAAVAAEIEGAGGQALTVAMDVRREAEWTRLFEATVERFGAVHGLVNNAGVHVLKALEDHTADDFDWIMDSNVKSVFFATRAAFAWLPRFATRDEPGSIVNLSSTAGLMGASFQVLYNTSKGAVQLLTKASAQEAIDRRLPIRVNSVNPGMVDTDMGDDIVGTLIEFGLAADAAQARKNLTRGYMDRRFARPQEVAHAICFLLGSEASFTTGLALTVDGGFANA